MNYLEIVQLTKSKPASELTLQEAARLREAVAAKPELYYLLGGKDEFERYMAEAPDVTGLSDEEIAARDLEDRRSRETKAEGSHRAFWLTTCLAILVFSAVAGWIYRMSLDAKSRLDGETSANLAHAADSKQNGASGESASVAEADESEIGANSRERTDGGLVADTPDGKSDERSSDSSNPEASDTTPGDPSTGSGPGEHETDNLAMDAKPDGDTSEDEVTSDNDAATTANQRATPRPITFALFEDEGEFSAVDTVGARDRLVAPLVQDDWHSGRLSVRLVPGNRFRLTLGQSLPVRQDPVDGEYRYLRFAFRKFGGGRICLELEDEHGDRAPVRYDAGRGSPVRDGAYRVWRQDLPSEWIVMTCDVSTDFGERDITSLTLTVPDGDYALFDHIYLSRTIEDLDAVADAPSAELTNKRARRVLAKSILSFAGPSVVSLESNGHYGTGVLIGNEGHILTCGHHLFALKGGISVRFADGRTARGRIAGICRNADCGLVKIVRNIGGLGNEISEKENHAPDGLYVGFSSTPQVNNGEVPASYIVELVGDEDGLLWTNFAMKGAALGGPLVDREGRVIGIHVRTSPDGRMGFAKLTEVRAQWKRLTRDERWGKWPPGAGPMIGVVTTAIEDGSRVDRVVPDSPAAKAGLQVGHVIRKVNGHAVRSYLDIGREIADRDPGDSAEFQIEGDVRQYDRRIRLMYRHEFPLP
jgi:S1-C subfamily serine protease